MAWTPLWTSVSPGSSWTICSSLGRAVSRRLSLVVTLSCQASLAGSIYCPPFSTAICCPASVATTSHFPFFGVTKSRCSSVVAIVSRDPSVEKTASLLSFLARLVSPGSASVIDSWRWLGSHICGCISGLEEIVICFCASCQAGNGG